MASMSRGGRTGEQMSRIFPCRATKSFRLGQAMMYIALLKNPTALSYRFAIRMQGR